MQAYRDYRPTVFDVRGLAGESHGISEYLVAPVMRTRDSDALEESNFAVALNMLGGESGDVEVHRFGHWGPGWFEIILVRPGTSAAAIAADIEDRLEDYPVLDETDWSEREYSEACERWDGMSTSERIEYCARAGVSIFAARHDEIPDGVYEYITH